MKQLLIVNSQKALNAKAVANGANVTPYDFMLKSNCVW